MLRFLLGWIGRWGRDSECLTALAQVTAMLGEQLVAEVDRQQLAAEAAAMQVCLTSPLHVPYLRCAAPPSPS